MSRKDIQMKPRLLVILAVVSLFVPALGHAQEQPERERMIVDVNYGGGNFPVLFTYPKDLTVRSGEQYGTKGIRLATEIKIVGPISAGYRFEHIGLRNGQGVFESILSDKTIRQTEPDLAFSDGRVKYQELFVSLNPSTMSGNSLIIGIAKSELARSWMWHNQDEVGTSRYLSSSIGPVFGVIGRQRIKKISIEYAVRTYPKLTQTIKGEPILAKPESIGFELHGSATWMVTRHVGLTGGYQFRWIGSDITTLGANGEPWPMHENQTTKSVIIGTRFSF